MKCEVLKNQFLAFNPAITAESSLQLLCKDNWGGSVARNCTPWLPHKVHCSVKHDCLVAGVVQVVTMAVLSTSYNTLACVNNIGV